MPSSWKFRQEQQAGTVAWEPQHTTTIVVAAAAAVSVVAVIIIG